MLNLIISVVTLVSCLLVGFLPPFTCWIGLVILYIISSVTIYSVLSFYKENFKDIKKIIALVISVLTLIYGYELMAFSHNYNETKKGLNKEFSNYKIVGIEKDNNTHGCKYLYKVKLNDSADILFHAGYCWFSGTDIPYYDTMNDYIDYYLPYYLNLYNKENNTNIKANKENNNNYTIYYNKDNSTDVYNFVKYLLNQNKNAKYQLKFYNEDTKKNNYFNSWNNESYLNFLLKNINYHNYK